MLQGLLAKRLGCGFTGKPSSARHTYWLSEGGPKFKAAEPDESTNYRITGNSISLERGTSHEWRRSSRRIRQTGHRPNRTQRHYDLSYSGTMPHRRRSVPAWMRPSRRDDRGSIFSAIQDQLGLRLVSQRRPLRSSSSTELRDHLRIELRRVHRPVRRIALSCWRNE